VKKAEKESSDAKRSLATQESLVKALQEKAERLEADCGRLPLLEEEAKKAARLGSEIEILKSEHAHEIKELKREQVHLEDKLRQDYAHKLESALLKERLELQEKHAQ
jgi:hypothetical protein